MSVGNGVPYMGYDSIMGIAQETTFGTYVTATAFIEFNTEGVKTEIEELVRESINGTRFFKKRLKGNQTTSGNVEMDFNPASDATCYLLKQAMGGTVSSSTIASGVYTHTFLVGNMESNDSTGGAADVKSLSLSIRRGTTDTFNYYGGRVNTLTLKGDVNSPVIMTVDMAFKGASTSSTIPSASFSDVLPVNFTGVTIKTADNLGSVAAEYFKSFELSINNNIYTDVRVLGSREPAQLPPGKQSIKLKLAQQYDTITSYNRFIQNTSTVIQITMDSGITIGGTGGTATTYSCVINLANCYVNSTNPQVGDNGVLMYELDVTGMYGSTMGSTMQVYVNNATISY